MEKKVIMAMIFCAILFALMTLMFYSSLAGPSDWSSDVKLTDDVDNSVGPAVAVDEDNIHVVWTDSRDGHREIYYKRSTDNGKSWSNDTRLTNTRATLGSDVAVDGNTVHVVYVDNSVASSQIYYIRSTDNGESWNSEVRLTQDGEHADAPAVAVNGNIIHVVWMDIREGNFEIYHKKSMDNGENWSIETCLSTSEGLSSRPAVSVDKNNVYAVWYDGRDNNAEIYYARSTNYGDIWNIDMRLTYDATTSDHPAVAVEGSTVHVVWYAYGGGDREIYYKKSAVNGESWGSETRLTNDAAGSEYPAVAAEGNNVHVIWTDYRDGNGNAEIYYKKSADNGESWGNDTRLTNDIDDSLGPDVAVDGDNVHIVWTDDRDGNWEIYYKQKIVQQQTTDIFDFAVVAIVVIIGGVLVVVLIMNKNKRRT